MDEDLEKSHIPQLITLFQSLSASQKIEAYKQMRASSIPPTEGETEQNVHSCEFCGGFIMSSTMETVRDMLSNRFMDSTYMRDPIRIRNEQESITTSFYSKTKHYNSITLARALSDHCVLGQWIFELLSENLRDFKAALKERRISAYYRGIPNRSRHSPDNPINDLDYIDQAAGLRIAMKFSTLNTVDGILNIDHRLDPELLDRLCATMPNAEKNQEAYNKIAREYEYPISMRFTGYTTAESPATKWIASRPPRLSLPAEDSFEIARRWLEECLKHEECPKTLGILPARVIDIGTQSPVRIAKLRWTEEGELGNYIALSYCWGGKQSFTTTKRTAQDFTDGIPISKLPKTIRDAIVVTQELGLRFIWIDALCIIQDDSEDVAREINNMAQVYREAYLTLSAACARSVDDGFLSCQHVKPLASFKVPLTHEGKESGSVYIHKPETFSHTEDPIHVRACRCSPHLHTPDGKKHLTLSNLFVISPTNIIITGTLQEHALSRRTLTYGSQGIWFNCHTNSHFDREHIFRDVPIPRSIRNTYHIDTINIDSWRTLVHTYTRRFLSFPSDKLPAIAGIAAYFSTDIGGAYLAGLWEKHLPSELMWCASRADIARPLDARAPSWSWAAVDGEVHHRWCEAGITTGPRGLRVVNFHVERRSSASSFGTVDPAKCMLRVEGHVAELRWDREWNQLYTRSPWSSVGRAQADTLDMGVQDTYMDVGALIVQEEPCRGLLLECIGGDKFRRVGIFYRFWEPEANLFERRMITIV